MSKRIIIDPGHGGSDSGAGGYGLQEKNLNLDIALHLRSKLANYADISMTRTSDTFVSLSDRAAFANKAAADFFISIHINAGGGSGFESYTYINASAENEHLREIIHQEVAAFYKANGFIDRGMKRANFAVLRETHMPSVLLENLFIDSQADAQKLKDSVFRENIAAVIANGVIKALNLQDIIPQPTPLPLPQPLPQPTPPPITPPGHWASADFERLVKAGLVQGQHNLDTAVTWGEMSAIFARLLDRLNL